MPSELSRVSVYYGEADPFWDACFTPEQRAYAEVENDHITRISVMVEPDGSVVLNAGYAERSPEYEDENSLFENFREAIEEELTKELPSNNPAYATFLTQAAEDAVARRESLDELEAKMTAFEDENAA